MLGALWQMRQGPDQESPKENEMSKSKKGKTPDKTSKPSQQSGRRQFLRNAGVMGAGAVMAVTGLKSAAKAQSPDDMLNVDVKLDADKIKAIQACLAKGTLRISMTKAAAVSADTQPDSWLYD